MDFFSASELTARAARSSGSLYNFANEAILAKEARQFSSYQTFDIFLSHSFLDAPVVYGLKRWLEDSNLSVYVYWIEDASQNQAVTADTAERIRSRMKSCKALLYATSENADHSKWMPWELGYFDGRVGKVAVCPITTKSTFEGREYIGLYPIMEKDLWLHKNGQLFKKLTTWINE